MEKNKNKLSTPSKKKKTQERLNSFVGEGHQDWDEPLF